MGFFFRQAGFATTKKAGWATIRCSSQVPNIEADETQTSRQVGFYVFLVLPSLFGDGCLTCLALWAQISWGDTKVDARTREAPVVFFKYLRQHTAVRAHTNEYKDKRDKKDTAYIKQVVSETAVVGVQVLQ